MISDVDAVLGWCLVSVDCTALKMETGWISESSAMHPASTECHRSHPHSAVNQKRDPHQIEVVLSNCDTRTAQNSVAD